MIKNIIGDKTVFAIEYSISDFYSSFPYAYGECQIWLDSNCLGGLEGEVYLTRVCKILQSVHFMADRLALPENIYDLSNVEIFKIMEENQLDEEGTYWLLDTEGFDMMSKYVYYRNNILFFLWQYRLDEWNGVKAWGLPGQLFSAEVPLSTYIEVTDKFRDSLVTIGYRF